MKHFIRIDFILFFSVLFRLEQIQGEKLWGVGTVTKQIKEMVSFR